VKDAKSAIRYLKSNSDELGINPEKIVASGGSAGGHLAACTAVIKGVNEDTDDLSISSVPFALVLFNPVVDTGKRGYGQEKLAGREFEVSPVHHITKGVPLTLIMHGKSDTTVPYENVVRFKQLMKQDGNKCILVGYKHQKHGFFNYSKKPKYFKKTLSRTEDFLEDNNLLRGESWVKKYFKELGKR
jgi:acetyl esterase/lipase